MAVVKLGNKVKTNLPDTIRYVINPEKNDGGRLVYASYSSERHDANTLAEPMIRDLERCANGLRKDGVLALHLKHSFSPDEHVSAEQVHELGVMLTEAITGGDYKYVVSTHMDRHHLHNHIVICAANRRTGRKMRLTRRSIDRCARSATSYAVVRALPYWRTRRSKPPWNTMRCSKRCGMRPTRAAGGSSESSPLSSRPRAWARTWANCMRRRGAWASKSGCAS